MVKLLWFKIKFFIPLNLIKSLISQKSNKNWWDWMKNMYLQTTLLRNKFSKGWIKMESLLFLILKVEQARGVSLPTTKEIPETWLKNPLFFSSEVNLMCFSGKTWPWKGSKATQPKESSRWKDFKMIWSKHQTKTLWRNTERCFTKNSMRKSGNWFKRPWNLKIWRCVRESLKVSKLARFRKNWEMMSKQSGSMKSSWRVRTSNSSIYYQILSFRRQLMKGLNCFWASKKKSSFIVQTKSTISL